MGLTTTNAYFTGADNQIRTDDLRFTKALLYQLSYTGELDTLILPAAGQKVNMTNFHLLSNSFVQSDRTDYLGCHYR